MEENITKPLARGTTIEYCLRSTNEHETGKVLEAGYYVLLVLNEQGYERFVFYDEIKNVTAKENELAVGSIIAYRLLPSQLPTNPNKIWRGKVVKNYPLVHMCYVEILEPGYTGLHEFVYYSQVGGIEKPLNGT